MANAGFHSLRSAAERAHDASEAARRKRAPAPAPTEPEAAALLRAAEAGDVDARRRCAGLFETPKRDRKLYDRWRKGNARAAARAAKEAAERAARTAWLAAAEPWLSTRRAPTRIAAE